MTLQEFKASKWFIGYVAFIGATISVTIDQAVNAISTSRANGDGTSKVLGTAGVEVLNIVTGNAVHLGQKIFNTKNVPATRADVVKIGGQSIKEDFTKLSKELSELAASVDASSESMGKRFNEAMETLSSYYDGNGQLRTSISEEMRKKDAKHIEHPTS